jgi:tetratricopeptide (TPR) repeat protein
VYQERTFPEVEYSFKHVLAQQAVYQAILASRRAELHRRVAWAIEALYGANLAGYCEQLAYHFEQAGNNEKTVQYLRMAAEKEIHHYANASAVAVLDHALQVLRTLPDSSERDAQELDLLIALGSPLTAMKGYTTPEVGSTYGRARELARRLGDTSRLFPALHGLGRFHLNRSHPSEAHMLARDLMDLAQASQDPGLLLEAHRALGYVLHSLGDAAGALAHAQEGLALYDTGAYQPHALLYGQNPATSLLYYAGVDQWLLGYPDRALQCAQRLLSLADKASDPLSRAVALEHAAELYTVMREFGETEKHASAVIEIASANSYPFWLADALGFHGSAISWQGRVAEGVGEMERALAMLRALGHAPSGRTLGLAEAYALAGRMADALSTVDEAQCRFANAGAHADESTAYQIKGEVLLKLGRSEEAETCLQRALEIARGDRLKGIELRAAISMARLWRDQGKAVQAYALLRPVYEWFNEGFGTADLAAAKALLDELARPGQ